MSGLNAVIRCSYVVFSRSQVQLQFELCKCQELYVQGTCTQLVAAYDHNVSWHQLKTNRVKPYFARHLHAYAQQNLEVRHLSRKKCLKQADRKKFLCVGSIADKKLRKLQSISGMLNACTKVGDIQITLLCVAHKVLPHHDTLSKPNNQTVS